jgi:hypothetical protein
MDRRAASQKTEFVEFFRESVHDTLKNILGEMVAKTVVSILQVDEHLHDPRELHETFHCRLYPIVKEGVVTLERAIAKDLHRRAGLCYEEEPPFDFVKCVARVREALRSSGSSSIVLL